jgi:D-ribulokinase
MAEVALGIDIGTSGVRIAATGRDGALVTMSAAPIMAPLQTGGRALQDPQLWWQALEQAFAALNLAGHEVKALAVDGTSGTILPVAADGRPLGLASMYNDVAEASDLARIVSVAPQETAALGSTSPLARAFPMAKGAVRILHQADWIVGKLCGEFSVSDENNALKTGYDPVARQWPEWIARAGFDVALLPRVVAAGTKVGAARNGAFNLPKSVAVVAGTTDGCAAFLASGASQPGDGVTSLGTTLTLKVLSAKPVFAPAFGIYSHRIGDQWLPGGASNTGGAVIARHFKKDEILELSEHIDPERPSGLDYYPLNGPGERFPVNDPAFPPRLTPVPADRATFLKGVLEGIARIEAAGYAKLAELGATPLQSIRSVGGGASNAAWTRIRLKALRAASMAAASEHAAVGAARLAWRGIGHAN